MGLYPSLGSWSPASLGSNLFLWARASNCVTASGAVVSASDLSSNGRSWAQATPINRPQFIERDPLYNGRSTWAFAGNEWIDSVTSYTLPQPFAVWMAFSVSGLAAFETGVDSEILSPRAIVRAGGGGAGIASIFAGTEVSSGKPITAKSIVCAVFNGAASSVRVNSKTPVLVGDPGASALAELRIGAGYLFVYPMQVGSRFAEIFVASGLPSTDTINAAMDYGAANYAVTLV